MSEYNARRNKNRRPTHPGVMFATTVLPALGRTKTEIAELLRLSRQSLYNISAGRQPVTPETAVRFGKLCGNGPVLWLNMQTVYDQWQAESEGDVSRIPPLRSAEVNRYTGEQDGTQKILKSSVSSDNDGGDSRD